MHKGKKVLSACRQNFTLLCFLEPLSFFVLQCGLWADNSQLTNNPNISFLLQKTISDKWKEVSLSASDSFIMSPVIRLCAGILHISKRSIIKQLRNLSLQGLFEVWWQLLWSRAAISYIFHSSFLLHAIILGLHHFLVAPNNT